MGHWSLCRMFPAPSCLSGECMSAFMWGCGTSAYQIEGALGEDGRGESIWDVFGGRPGAIRNGDHAEPACDHYHRMEEDLDLLRDLGVNAYRFSISWPRLFPVGRGTLLEAGAAWYDRLINGCLDRGIQPCATLYHWDLPQVLQAEYGGWLSPRIVEDFRAYARACFQRYGDRVKLWVSFNEPWCTSILGHGLGVHAPGRKSADEPFLTGHHQLLAHAATAEVFRGLPGTSDGGRLGFANNCDWREPFTDTDADREAAEVALEFMLGWFADPVWFGDYPGSMRCRLGDRLPRFTDEERSRLQGSVDFFGLNHYSACYARKVDQADASWVGNTGIFGVDDIALEPMPDVETNATGWAVVPTGFGRLLEWIDARYGRPPVLVLENGTCQGGHDHDALVDDRDRIRYLQGYLREMQLAREAGVDVQGYFHWSLLDNFEWSKGYDIRFGLVHVDFATGKRTPKRSFAWYRDRIQQAQDTP